MITIKKEQFLNAVKAIKTSCGKANLQPILSTIHLKTENGGITLTATDLNNSARTTCEANITTPVDICVNANNLENIINKMGETIKLETKESMLHIKSKSLEFKLLYVNSGDFPKNLNFDLEGERICFSSDEFVQNINQAVIATANDVYQNLNGVCFNLKKENGYELASTDGNRLIVVEKNTPVNIEGQFVIPKKTLIDVARVAKDTVEVIFAQIGINEKVIFKTNNCIFITSLLAKGFPIYKSLIPNNYTKKALINKNELINVLETVSIMSDTLMNISAFHFKGDKLEISTKSENGEAKDILDISFDDEIKIGFNYKFLLEGIKVFNTETLTFELDTPQSTCLIKDEGILYLIAPITLKN